ncbi:MAG TPA: STAS domain-containing protein [Acidimicrobiia bacterium]
MLGTCTALVEIDRSTVASFHAHLRDAIDSSDEALVSIDCSGVTFMDSAGYRALVDATRYATRHGHTLVIRDMSSACAMLIRLYNTGGDLRVEPRQRQPARNGLAFAYCRV